MVTYKIVFDLANMLLAIFSCIIPGKKLCATYWKKLKLQPNSSASTRELSIASAGESF